MNLRCHLCHTYSRLTESVSCVQSAVYPALIEHVRHASFRKVLVSPLLSCFVWGHVSGASVNIHTRGPAHTFRHVHSPEQYRPFQHGVSFYRFLFTWRHTSCWDHLGGTEWWCTLFRKCGTLQWSRSSLCGRRKRLWQCWCGCWGSVRGSEPERPSGVSSLTTGRTPEPLNPGPHSARSTAPWDSSRGALTAPVFWLDSRHSQSRAVHDDSPSPRLNQDHKYSPERVSVCSCFLRCLWLSHSFMLSSQPEPGSTQTHTHTCRHVEGTENTCSHKHRHIYQVCMYRQTCDSD